MAPRHGRVRAARATGDDVSDSDHGIEVFENVLGARIQELQAELAPESTRVDVAQVLRRLADDIEAASLTR